MRPGTRSAANAGRPRRAPGETEGTRVVVVVVAVPSLRTRPRVALLRGSRRAVLVAVVRPFQHGSALQVERERQVDLAVQPRALFGVQARDEPERGIGIRRRTRCFRFGKHHARALQPAPHALVRRHGRGRNARVLEWRIHRRRRISRRRRSFFSGNGLRRFSRATRRETDDFVFGANFFGARARGDASNHGLDLDRRGAFPLGFRRPRRAELVQQRVEPVVHGRAQVVLLARARAAHRRVQVEHHAANRVAVLAQHGVDQLIERDVHARAEGVVVRGAREVQRRVQLENHAAARLGDPVSVVPVAGVGHRSSSSTVPSRSASRSTSCSTASTAPSSSPSSSERSSRKVSSANCSASSTAASSEKSSSGAESPRPVPGIEESGASVSAPASAARSGSADPAGQPSTGSAGAGASADLPATLSPVERAVWVWGARLGARAGAEGKVHSPRDPRR